MGAGPSIHRRRVCVGLGENLENLYWSARAVVRLVSAKRRATLRATMPPVASATLAAPVVPSPTARAAGSSTPLVLALAAVYVIWGSTYLAMRIAVGSLPPMLMGAVRFTLAGGLLLLIARATGTPWPTRRQWLAALPTGALLFVGGNGLVAVAEVEVTSGVAALVCATMPLWMAIFSTLVGERPTRREWLGVGLGVAGVVVLVSGAELSASPSAAAILCVSPAAWALGSLLSKKLPSAPGLGAAASQQLAGGLALAITGVARGEHWPVAPTTSSIVALGYLIVLGSLVGFTAYAWLLRNARPAVATSYAFVNPVLAVVLGVVLVSEPLTGATLIAAPLVVAAVVLVIGGRARPVRA